MVLTDLKSWSARVVLLVVLMVLVPLHRLINHK